MIKHLSALLIFSALSYAQSGDSSFFQNNQTKLDSTLTSVSDIASVTDTVKTNEVTEKDTLVPVQGRPLTDVSYIINKKKFMFDNYRYTGDLLRSFNINFVKDLGFVGYPSESFIYGIGDNGVSYLQDGVFMNNRYINSLDRNLVQSEDIDSIEIVPSPRGFLYGPYNNSVTVNFITRDFISREPYSRIKYYEGPDGEAMFDGKFSALVAKRWNLSFQVTNRSKDETYINTDLSLWQVNTKIKYFLSNAVNITGSYYYVRKKQGLNGGVDLDSLNKISDSPGSDLYNPFIAPVVYPNQKHDIIQHNFSLRTLTKPFDDSQLDLSIYYKYGLAEFRNLQDSININRDLEEKVLGANLDYFQRISSVSLQLFSLYESNTYRDKNQNILNGITTNENYENLDVDIFSIGGILSFYLFDDNFKASTFLKHNSSGNNHPSLTGTGIDLNYRLLNKTKFYLGISSYENYNLKDAGSFEVGAMFNYYKLFLDFKYFDTDYNLYTPEIFYGPGPLEVIPTVKVKGLGLELKYKLWLLLLETNTSYYFNHSRGLPEWQFIGGIYVNDMFFDDNLKLKAGFKFHYTGEISPGYYFFIGNIEPVGGASPTNKLDFTLAGEIKKVAIAYFIWENLFGNMYYITPYYPMPERNIRFGLAWELFN